jgi:hypothetical protein
MVFLLEECLLVDYQCYLTKCRMLMNTVSSLFFISLVAMACICTSVRAESPQHELVNNSMLPDVKNAVVDGATSNFRKMIRLSGVPERDWPRLVILDEMPACAEAAFLGQIPSAQSATRDTSTHRLASWSIRLDKKGKLVPENANVRLSCGVHDVSHTNKSIKEYPLTRSGEKNFVAIVRVSFGSRMPILNPLHGFDYGPIPQPKDMTIAQAEALWGEKINVEEKCDSTLSRRCYRLISTNRLREIKEFFIDCEFKDDRLIKYKVCTEELPKEQSLWVTPD